MYNNVKYIDEQVYYISNYKYSYYIKFKNCEYLYDYLMDDESEEIFALKQTSYTLKNVVRKETFKQSGFFIKNNEIPILKKEYLKLKLKKWLQTT